MIMDSVNQEELRVLKPSKTGTHPKTVERFSSSMFYWNESSIQEVHGTQKYTDIVERINVFLSSIKNIIAY